MYIVQNIIAMDDIEAELNISVADFDSPGNETTNQEFIKNPLHIEAPSTNRGNVLWSEDDNTLAFKY